MESSKIYDALNEIQWKIEEILDSKDIAMVAELSKVVDEIEKLKEQI